MKAICLFLLIICLLPNTFGQSFENGNLEGDIPEGSISVLPPGWEFVEFTEIISEATSAAQTTSDLTDSIAPHSGAGIIGNPYAGETFVSGNYAYFEGPDWMIQSHEGIKQYVNDFCPGNTYEISFYQTVVKQSNLLDTSGRWRVFLDNDLILESEPTISHEAFNSLDLPWERRTVTFIVTETAHYIKFLPGDDDDSTDGMDGLSGGLRMGIDSISLRVIPVDLLEYEDLLGNDTSMCAGESFTLFADADGVTFEWQDSSDGASFEVTESGLYWVDISNSCGGTYRDSIEVSFNPSPILDLGDDTSVCNIETVLDAENPGMSYLWQDESTDQFYTVSDTGTYSVLITSDSGCVAFDQITFSAGKLDITIGNDTLICAGELITLDVELPGSILWSTGETSETIIIETEGIYWVEIQDGLCTAEDTINIQMQTPLIDFNYWDTIGCDPYATHFEAIAIEEAIVSWQWDFGDGNSSTLAATSNYYLETGEYLIQLLGTTALGCVAEKNLLVPIIVYPQPMADFNFTPEFPLTNETVYFTDLSTGELEWEWDFGNGSESGSENPETSFENPNDFEVTLIASNHICADTIVKLITIKNDLIYYVPNAFTPDGDALNNTFQPVFTSGFDPYDYHLTIFNRWGEILFESYDTSYGWNGIYGDNAAATGVYVWKIEFGDLYTDQRVNEMGHVTLLR